MKRKKKMKLNDVYKKLDLELLTQGLDLEVEITRAFCGDMLSEVMGNAREGALWVTIQIHENALAIALLKGFSAVIFSSGRRPEANIISKAMQEEIPLFISEKTSFEISGMLFQAGLEA
jgi:predicted transcriptional regulator